MTTGAEFPNFTNKRLMSFQDFAARTIGYLQELNREVTEIQFSEGAFGEKLPMDSPGSDQVRLNVKPVVGDYKVHDGNGHLLDLQNDNVALFENAVAITYEVGAGFIRQPVEIAINPRTGKPDYDRYVEAVGDEAEPNSVTDNGSNITFRVDTLNANGGESLAGRTVRVFKKIPADDATTEAVAIEELTASFGGGQNTVTTAGLLGQATVSTVPGDYTVQLVGLSVRRNTNPAPLSASASHFFAGTVLGNGGTPVAFDITNQFIIQANSASGIVFSPHTGPAPISWNVNGATVQTAIAEIIDELSDKTFGTYGGAENVGVNSSGYSAQLPVDAVTPWGGLGTALDSVGQAIAQISTQLTKGRATATFSDTGPAALADFAGANSYNTARNAYGGDGLFISKGAGPHQLVSSLGQDWIIASHANQVMSPNGSQADMTGSYQRIRFAGDGGGGSIDLGNYSSEVSAHIREAILDHNSVVVRCDETSVCSVRSMVTDISAPSLNGPTLNYGLEVANAQGPVLVENAVFIGTPQTLNMVRSAINGSSKGGVILFQNCAFVETGLNAGQDFVQQATSAEPGHTFINCAFFRDHTDATDEFMFKGYAADMYGCKFWIRSGGWADFQGGTVHACSFAASNEAASTANPRILEAQNTQFTDITITLGSSIMDTSTQAQHPIDLSFCMINGLRLFISGAAASMPSYSLMRIHNFSLTDGARQTTVDNVQIIGPGDSLVWASVPGGANNPAIIEMDAGILVQDEAVVQAGTIVFHSLGADAGDTNGPNVTLLDLASVCNVDKLHVSESGAGMHSAVRMRDASRLGDVRFTNGYGETAVMQVEGPNCSIDAITVAGDPVAAGAGATEFLKLLAGSHYFRLGRLYVTEDWDAVFGTVLVDIVASSYVAIREPKVILRSAIVNPIIQADASSDYAEVSDAQIFINSGTATAIALNAGANTKARGNTMITAAGAWATPITATNLADNNTITSGHA